jgi:hypothetical protein
MKTPFVLSLSKEAPGVVVRQSFTTSGKIFIP